MKKRRFTPTQIAGILKEFELGKSTAEISREHGISQAAFYKWRQRYGGMDASDLKKLKALRREPQAQADVRRAGYGSSNGQRDYRKKL